MAPELSVAEPAEPVLARSEQVESLETPVPAEDLAPPVATDDADVAADAVATEAAADEAATDEAASDEAASDEAATDEAAVEEEATSRPAPPR